MAASLDTGALRYERFFQASGDILCVLDPAGRFVRTNKAFHESLGHPEEHLLEEGFASLLHPDDAPSVRLFLQKSEGDGLLRTTARLRHADLTYRTLSLSLRRVAEDATIYAIGRQPTPRLSNEERRHAELLMMMQKTAQVGGWEVDCVTNESYWTDETFQIHDVPLGYRSSVETGIQSYAPEARPLIAAAVNECFAAKPYQLEVQLITGKGGRVWVRTAGKAVIEDGKVIRLVGGFQNIDSFKRRELELQEKLAIIQEQRSAIRALSAPIITVWDRVLALPVVGTLNEERAEDITGRMLDAVVANAARYAILDLTGVEVVDEGTANHLMKIIQAIQLLGAKSIVTGIGPAMARTLVALGADFGDAQTVRNLREAIKISMRDDPAVARAGS
ncbi:MAG: PAS domain S-box protein [Byssovorax sp.]